MDRSIDVIERDQRLPEAYRYFFPGSLSVCSCVPGLQSIGAVSFAIGVVVLVWLILIRCCVISFLSPFILFHFFYYYSRNAVDNSKSNVSKEEEHFFPVKIGIFYSVLDDEIDLGLGDKNVRGCSQETRREKFSDERCSKRKKAGTKPGA